MIFYANINIKAYAVWILKTISCILSPEIDFENKLIYTTQFVCRDFLEIVHINENTNYILTPSYEYQNNCWYGTGSQIQIQDNDSSTEITYTLIVQGDINGDSAVFSKLKEVKATQKSCLSRT